MLTMLKIFDNVENLDNEGLDPPKYLQKEDLVFMTKGTVWHKSSEPKNPGNHNNNCYKYDLQGAIFN